MSQNNMINFITLTDIEAGKVELNPNFIAFMTRETYQPEENVDMPFTNIYLSFGRNLHVLETPEEISNLQMATISKTMAALMPIMQQAMEDFQ